MTEDNTALKDLEGSVVDVRLRDGSRLSPCELVSARRRAGTIWLCIGGLNAFIPTMDVADVALAAPPSVATPECTGSGERNGQTVIGAGSPRAA